MKRQTMAEGSWWVNTMENSALNWCGIWKRRGKGGGKWLLSWQINGLQLRGTGDQIERGIWDRIWEMMGNRGGKWLPSWQIDGLWLKGTGEQIKRGIQHLQVVPRNSMYSIRLNWIVCRPWERGRWVKMVVQQPWLWARDWWLCKLDTSLWIQRESPSSEMWFSGEPLGGRIYILWWWFHITSALQLFCHFVVKWWRHVVAWDQWFSEQSKLSIGWTCQVVVGPHFTAFESRWWGMITSGTGGWSGRIVDKKDDEEFFKINAPAWLPILLKLLGNWIFVGMHCAYLTPWNLAFTFSQW